MKSGLFLLKLRPQYHVLKPQLYYSNWIIPPPKNICYTCQHLSDHIILKTNMVAAEPTSHPLLNTSCVGATRPQQLSGSLSEQFDVTARSPTTTTQPDRSNIDLPIIPWGLGASQCLYVEVCGRVARSSGDIYTTQDQLTLVSHCERATLDAVTEERHLLLYKLSEQHWENTRAWHLLQWPFLRRCVTNQRGEKKKITNVSL